MDQTLETKVDTYVNVSVSMWKIVLLRTGKTTIIMKNQKQIIFHSKKSRDLTLLHTPKHFLPSTHFTLLAQY